MKNLKDNIEMLLVPGSFYKEYKKNKRYDKNIMRYTSLGIYTSLEVLRILAYEELVYSCTIKLKNLI